MVASVVNTRSSLLTLFQINGGLDLGANDRYVRVADRRTKGESKSTEEIDASELQNAYDAARKVVDALRTRGVGPNSITHLCKNLAQRILTDREFATRITPITKDPTRIKTI